MKLVITPEIDLMISASYSVHYSAELVSKETGISESAIYSSLKRQGIERSRKALNKHLARNNEIVSLFRALHSTRLVADKMNLPLKTVHEVLRITGIPTPRKGRRHNPYAACDIHSTKVLEMCDQGCSLAEMAEAVGTTGVEVKKFLRRNGVTKEFPKATYGEKHYAWKGRLLDKDGYVLIHCKGHPNARKHTHYIFEHRLVVEADLGRYLLPTEVIHHLDGDRQNNSVENLQVFQSNGEHLAVDLAGRCPKWSQAGKERIRKALLQRWSDWRTSNPTSSEDDVLPCT